MNLKSRKNGISLISLIITIIVIIILAAIVIFSGMDTPEKAQLSKVISDIDNVQTAVDQAYYGLYTEKAVAGEVWTQSQFYEAVAKGITNRDELSGDTGIIQIESTSLASINLPEYEGRVWGIALEDIDETTKVGNVVLAPGFESNGKIYSTLLDTQNGGRDNQLTEGIKTNMEVKNLIITTDSNGNTVAGTGITEGTTLYINFDASENGQRVEVSPSLLYAVTKNGEYNFSLASTSGSAKTYTVTVSNYKEKTLADMVKVGDYIDYKPDSSTYSTNSENTGYTSQELTTATDTAWRVLYIDPDTNEVLITTQGPVNFETYLSGIKGYLRGPSELNTICKELYSNTSLGLTARSMTIEDLNKACGYTPTTMPTRYAYYPKGTTVRSGDTYTNIAHRYETAKFYTYIDGGIEKNDEYEFKYREPIESSPVLVSSEAYWYAPAEKQPTVGNILQGGDGWLASTCMDNDFSYASFNIYSVDSNSMFTSALCFSNGESQSQNSGLRPLVTLSSKLQIDMSDTSRDGKSKDTAWKIMLKE